MKKILFFSFVTILLISMTACVLTTANFTELTMASEVDANQKPVVKTNTFSTDTPVIYVTGTLNNAPEGTVVVTSWYYLENDSYLFIDGVSMGFVDSSTDFSFSLSRPTTGWPVGDYKVELIIDEAKTSTITFKVN